MARRSPDTDSGDDGDGVPPAVIEDILDAPARRRLLDCLLDSDEPVAVDDLAEDLALSRDASSPVGQGERRDHRTEIYQTHLPKLTATEVVAFDSMRGLIRFTGPEELERTLDTRSVPGR